MLTCNAGGKGSSVQTYVSASVVGLRVRNVYACVRARVGLLLMRSAGLQECECLL